MKIDPNVFSELKDGGNVSVTSAHPLSETDKKEIVSIFKKISGDVGEISYTTDKNLLAGVVLKCGSTIVDFSLHGQLLNLKQELFDAT